MSVGSRQHTSFAARARLMMLAAALSAPACATRPYRPPPAVAADALFRSDVPLRDDRSIAQLPWQALFADPVLRALIADGLLRNLDLKDALARIEIAEANLRQSKEAFAPTLQADASYGTSKQASNRAITFPRIEQAQVTASASWELDVWGKFRSGKLASEAQLEASWAYKHAVQTQLIADIASAYYALLAYDQQLAFTQRALEVRIADVEAVKALKEGAVVTGADVVQSEANRYAAEVSIPDIKRNIRETENALSVLLARPPHAIRRTGLDRQTAPAQIELGVSSQLLANRPDVRAAEQSFRSAFELSNVARSYFYPSFTLTGSAGTASPQISGLFGPGTFIGGIAGGLMQPILNRGVNRQRLSVAKAQQKQALYDFQQTLLRAGEEVSNAVYAYQMAVEKAEARKQQLAALEKAVEFTKALLRYTSDTNYVDVLTAEQSLLTAQINSVNDRLQQLQAVVRLYRALGGGWQEPGRAAVTTPTAASAR